MTTDPLARGNVTVFGNLMAKKSMIFVNGLGYDQSFWNLVAASFADNYRLVTFDNVGSVQSNQAIFRQNQLRYLTVNGYATDLLEICAALNLKEEIIVVGHSLGALAGMLASIQKPSIFSKLVMLGASPRYTDTEDYRGGFSNDDINATYSALSNNYHAWSRQLAAVAMATPDSPALVDCFAETLMRIPQEMMLTVLCSVLQTDQRNNLAKVSVPTLIIQSRNDYFVPMEVADYLHTHIPASKLTVINAQGHFSHLSAPQEVISAIGNFIN
ncbi:alpha/beta fold hydrolase [Propionivibrio dicarboxylicus]|uniref:Pimeloyl-ACP methyl ester carboxylesterase n=1 Tax=Propionivibrio dicarboxylicus TaxID=83767 RepID=A0A1G8AJ24_9RHOO|nr:alpha/beta hydrolase [Propionivibrio dicarboxylicus]SDH21005.1 Pimeloyl-ACP methyl ester carboxylesterase [Propionivibrio dicarboxylicus]